MKKVLMMTSGGVDSAVSALLLKNQGYSVTCVTMDLLGKDSSDAIQKAKKTAKELQLPHIVVDLKEEFRQNVMGPFVKTYLNGKTPNPCAQCNKLIKFGRMLDFMQAKGFDYLATGHYARVEFDEGKKKYYLKKSPSQKDQSYFLYGLKYQWLSKILFPIGGYQKSEVKKIAFENKLQVAKNKESQDICFITNCNYKDFICKNSAVGTLLEGHFVDVNGKVLAKHGGFINYTIGQRKGLGVAFNKPKYVVQINASKNEVVLGDEEDLYKNAVTLKNVNVIDKDSFNENVPTFLHAKARFSSCESLASVKVKNNEAVVVFNKPQRALTPGQCVVFYSGDVVAGGGEICKVFNKKE